MERQTNVSTPMKPFDNLGENFPPLVVVVLVLVLVLVLACGLVNSASL